MLLKMNNKPAEILAAMLLCCATAPAAFAAPVDLVVLVVVDQLRGDMP
jgi:hypothetical protein